MSEALKKQIEGTLLTFAALPLRDAATRVLNTLGYHSERTGYPALDTEVANSLRAAAPDTLGWDTWEAFHLLFQITDEEINRQEMLFEPARLDNALMRSYIFVAVKLAGENWTRTELANITRFINTRIVQPIMVMFHYGDALTLAIINRRWDKRENPDGRGAHSRQVLEKVTLIKDINLSAPHRAHLDILAELSLDSLVQTESVHNFDTLHKAWEGILNTEALNRQFYGQLYAWYQWAVDECRFPDNAPQLQVIRLITRLLFIWFLKEKKLVPETLFEAAPAAAHLTQFSLETSDYYQAMLQNLFFATLNTPISERAFSPRNYQGHRDASKYRYADLLSNPAAFLAYLKQVPFVNGGLFDCLDTFEATRAGGARIDCFTDDANARRKLHVPAKLFFDENSGLFPLFSHYKFTVEENTPIEQEVALDPELLGQVFENLLGVYNPETQSSARKATGSYYTPRQIVDYMVDEALIAYFLQKVVPFDGDRQFLAARLRDDLLAYEAQGTADEPNTHLIHADEVEPMIAAIDALKIIDPAVGSGAFPMGILNKLVLILQKLDPQNAHWKALQLRQAATIPDPHSREAAFKGIENVFSAANRYNDYGRKLYLIQNCIYGVDIQPVACQIAKLRFFISLAIEQEPDNEAENLGIRPLPNLETRFLAANTLLGLKGEAMLTSARTQELERELVLNGERHFHAITREEKRACQKKDRALREALAAELREVGMPAEDAEKIASWDRYDTRAVADWFAPERMFGIREGFDVVIGNPPYVRHEKIRALKPALKTQFDSFFASTADISVYFYKRGAELLRDGGILTYICTNKFMRSGYGKNLRQFLTSEMSLRMLLDFGGVAVFEAAVDTCIALAEKGAPASEHSFRAASLRQSSEDFDVREAFETQSFLMQASQLTEEGWALTSPETFALIGKLQSAGTPLGEYTDNGLYRGLITGCNNAFIIDESARAALVAEDVKNTELIKPLLRGRDLRRWKSTETNRYLIAIASSANREWPWSDAKDDAEAERIFAETYPAIHHHLNHYRDRLLARDDQGKFYWEFRSCSYYAEFEKPKVIYSDISPFMRACYDTTNALCLQTTYVLPTTDLSLLAILNSRVFDWYARHKFQSLNDPWAGGGLRFIRQYMAHAPVAARTAAEKAELSRLVTQILADPGSDNVRALEREIDAVVYRLYGLSAAEVALIEGTYRDAGMGV